MAAAAADSTAATGGAQAATAEDSGSGVPRTRTGW